MYRPFYITNNLPSCRGSFSKFVGGLFGGEEEEAVPSPSPEKASVVSKGGGKRRKSWGELFLGGGATLEEPKRREIIIKDKTKKPAPKLKEIKKMEKKASKKRGFRGR